MLVYFFAAFSSAWFSTVPLSIPKQSVMYGEAIVKPCSMPLSYARGEYEMIEPSLGDTVLINMPNGNDLQWAVIIELMPTVKGGCKTF